MNAQFKHMLSGVLLLAVCLVFTGCGPTETAPKKNNGGANKKKRSEAHYHGSHKGHVFQVGESDFWYESAYDEAREVATFYFLKPDRKTPLMLPLKSVKYEMPGGEKAWELLAIEVEDGKAYKFQLEDKALVNALMIGGGNVVVMDGDKEVKGTKGSDPVH